eukprot:TRINITY_DN1461_c1_g1_i5.p1 TRINITY_DN1461_c1_g1~~TRINITY_DN1461_c1_g1_i5.p1  ORF type:complete len:1543 (+),score=511.76 TRINITY_DN1461_c1_g1_i5:27-4631(+)
MYKSSRRLISKLNSNNKFSFEIMPTAYLIPSLLPRAQPFELKQENYWKIKFPLHKENSNRTYSFKPFLPAGLFSRFISRILQYSENVVALWYSGYIGVVDYEGNSASVYIYLNGSDLQITIRSPLSDKVRSILCVLDDFLMIVANEWPSLDWETYAHVHINGSNTTETIRLEDIEDKILKKEDTTNTSTNHDPHHHPSQTSTEVDDSIKDSIDISTTSSSSILSNLSEYENILPDLVISQYNGPRIPWNNLKVINKLGEGSYAVVYLAEYKGMKVAIKAFKSDSDDQSNSTSKSQRKIAIMNFRKEVVVQGNIVSTSVSGSSGLGGGGGGGGSGSGSQKKIGYHPNIVSIIGICLNPLAIIFELCSKGDLYGLIHNQWNIHIPWSLKVKIALDVANGLKCLQEQSPPIIHGDFKSPNILLNSLNPTSKTCALIADFGTARYMYELQTPKNQNNNVTTNVDNPVWLAPEVMMNIPYDHKSDTYAYGVILWELVTRDHFHVGSRWMSDFTEGILRGERPPIPQEFCPKPFSSIIERCWSQDPKSRPEFNEVVKLLSEMYENVTQLEVWEELFGLPFKQHIAEKALKRKNEEEQKMKQRCEAIRSAVNAGIPVKLDDYLLMASDGDINMQPINNSFKNLFINHDYYQLFENYLVTHFPKNYHKILGFYKEVKEFENQSTVMSPEKLISRSKEISSEYLESSSDSDGPSSSSSSSSSAVTVSNLLPQDKVESVLECIKQKKSITNNVFTPLTRYLLDLFYNQFVSFYKEQESNHLKLTSTTTSNTGHHHHDDVDVDDDEDDDNCSNNNHNNNHDQDDEGKLSSSPNSAFLLSKRRTLRNKLNNINLTPTMLNSLNRVVNDETSSSSVNKSTTATNYTTPSSTSPSHTPTPTKRDSIKKLPTPPVVTQRLSAKILPTPPSSSSTSATSPSPSTYNTPNATQQPSIASSVNSLISSSTSTPTSTSPPSTSSSSRKRTNSVVPNELSSSCFHISKWIDDDEDVVNDPPFIVHLPKLMLTDRSYDDFVSQPLISLLNKNSVLFYYLEEFLRESEEHDVIQHNQQCLPPILYLFYLYFDIINYSNVIEISSEVMIESAKFLQKRWLKNRHGESDDCPLINILQLFLKKNNISNVNQVVSDINNQIDNDVSGDLFTQNLFQPILDFATNILIERIYDNDAFITWYKSNIDTSSISDIILSINNNMDVDSSSTNFFINFYLRYDIIQTSCFVGQSEGSNVIIKSLVSTTEKDMMLNLFELYLSDRQYDYPTIVNLIEELDILLKEIELTDESRGEHWKFVCENYLINGKTYISDAKLKDSLKQQQINVSNIIHNADEICKVIDESFIIDLMNQQKSLLRSLFLDFCWTVEIGCNQIPEEHDDLNLNSPIILEFDDILRGTSNTENRHGFLVNLSNILAHSTEYQQNMKNMFLLCIEITKFKSLTNPQDKFNLGMMIGNKYFLNNNNDNNEPSDDVDNSDAQQQQFKIKFSNYMDQLLIDRVVSMLKNEIISDNIYDPIKFHIQRPLIILYSYFKHHHNQSIDNKT